MRGSLPTLPPRWSRGDVGREIGRWIQAEILTALQYAGINGSKIDASHIVGLTAGGVSALKVAKNNILVGTEAELDLLEGANTTLTVVDDSANKRVQITIDAAAFDLEVREDSVYGPDVHGVQTIEFPTGSLTDHGLGVVEFDYNLVTGDLPAAAREVSINFQVGDGVNVLTNTERVQTIVVDFDATIQSNTVLADASGNITFDIKKCTYSGYPGSMTSIVAGAPPALAAAQKSQDTTLVGWTTIVAAGDILQVSVIGTPATVKAVTLALKVEKT